YVPEDQRLNPERLSITELEYRHARRVNKPVLAFIVQETPTTQIHPTRERQMERFIQDVMRESLAAFFSNPQDLATRFSEAIVLQFPQLRRAQIPTSGRPIDVFISVTQQDEPWCRAFQQEMKEEMSRQLGREAQIFRKSELLPNRYE